jgi:hypothetical protein
LQTEPFVEGRNTQECDALNHIEAPERYADSVTVNGETFVSVPRAAQATGANTQDILCWAALDTLNHFRAGLHLYVNEADVRRLAANAEAVRDARRDRYGIRGLTKGVHPTRTPTYQDWR